MKHVPLVIQLTVSNDYMENEMDETDFAWPRTSRTRHWCIVSYMESDGRFGMRLERARSGLQSDSLP